MSSAAEKTEKRLVARASVDIHQRIAEAADLVGATVSQFLLDSALERANRVTREAIRLDTSREAFLSMMDVLDQPARPLPRLRRAARQYKEEVNGEDKKTTTQPRT